MRKLFKIIAKILSKYNLYLAKSLSFDNGGRRKIAINLDYVRYSSLELCSYEINQNKVKGSVAELGVYKGTFASRINQLFPDRTLYLFDTFDGFDNRDLSVDKEKFSTNDEDFSDTSVEFVKNRMKYPEKCVFVKGYFPESAVNIDTTFAFVSLDVDLYEPTKNGLAYFYERLEKNGYIFIHDFNNKHYKGVRTAVLEFCELMQIGYLPLPDNCGSVIITK